MAVLIDEFPLDGEPSGRFPEPKRTPALAGDTPVEIIHLDIAGTPWRVFINFRCLACGYQDTRIAGGDDKAIDRMLAKIEAAPYCRDCRRCRAGRCRHADIGRCCIAGGREASMTKQGVLPGMDTSVVVEADIAAARSDAERWNARAGALGEIFEIVAEGLADS